ncbi:hypothetical protein MN116_007355 [Schistosoma mekongi]|uniref:Uncharacterized protein n=1 Tax=Schistosoma mekongi TaxID=38744 RepID=A0AAE1ZAE2_SCHME|nr:hypothetical protein MN116_007355 [Schistosoma mekongi]
MILLFDTYYRIMTDDVHRSDKIMFPTYRRNPGEIGVKLYISECQPIANSGCSSMNYFLANVREKFEQHILCNTNLLELKWCLEEENDEVFSGFILERIEPDLILIIYPDSIDRLQMIDSVKLQLVNTIQKYFDTTETRVTIGVDHFKIQLYINNHDIINAIHEWKTNMIPVVYHLEDSDKNLQMIRYAKLAQNKFFQINLWYIQQTNNKMITLIPDFLIYLKQLQLQSIENQLNIDNNLTKQINCLHDIKEFNECLHKIIGKLYDPKGLRCQVIKLILQILNDLYDNLMNILKYLILPLYQITPGCETLQQLNKKKIIKNSLKNLLNFLHTTNNTTNTNTTNNTTNTTTNTNTTNNTTNTTTNTNTTNNTTNTNTNNNNTDNNNNNVNLEDVDDLNSIPITLQSIIRNENDQKYGWMLCITTNVLNKLKNIDYHIDEYFFQFNYKI